MLKGTWNSPLRIASQGCGLGFFPLKKLLLCPCLRAFTFCPFSSLISWYRKPIAGAKNKMYGYLFESGELLSDNQYKGKNMYIAFREHSMESNAKF